MNTNKRQGIRRLTGLLFLLSFPIIMNWFSPYLSIWAASQGIIAGSVLTFAALLVSSLVVGRAFCGWVCPMGSLMDLVRPTRNRRVPRGHWVKYIIWVPWFVILAVSLIRGFTGWDLQPLFMTESGVSVSEPAHYMIFSLVLLLFLGLALAIGRRAACHTVCWIAPFMVAGRWVSEKIHLPALRLQAAQERCVSCKKCVHACPMSLDVNRMVLQGSMYHLDCILCGECVDTCPHGVLKYRFGKPISETT